jgi:hypothetical protein
VTGRLGPRRGASNNYADESVAYTGDFYYMLSVLVVMFHWSGSLGCDLRYVPDWLLDGPDPRLAREKGFGRRKPFGTWNQ